MKNRFACTILLTLCFCLYATLNVYMIYLFVFKIEYNGGAWLCYGVSCASFLMWLLCLICPQKLSTLMYAIALKMDEKSLLAYDVSSQEQIYKTIKKMSIHLGWVSLIFLIMGIFILLIC